MKPSACLINVARGGLVDEAAMYEAILKGALGGAGLDVFSTEPIDPTLEIFERPNVVTTPHIAGTTDGTSRKRAMVAFENVNRIANGQKPLYLVG